MKCTYFGQDREENVPLTRQYIFTGLKYGFATIKTRAAAKSVKKMRLYGLQRRDRLLRAPQDASSGSAGTFHMYFFRAEIYVFPYWLSGLDLSCIVPIFIYSSTFSGFAIIFSPFNSRLIIPELTV